MTAAQTGIGLTTPMGANLVDGGMYFSCLGASRRGGLCDWTV